ncbi:MAG: hypothetical protein P8J79_09455 [Halioglobus sp.]|nr:hypothetical protein [Halioglobus sp.]
MTPQAIGKILRDLEHLDYVRRSVDDTDKRARKVQLRERGKLLAQSSLDVVSQTCAYYANKVETQSLDNLK